MTDREKLVELVKEICNAVVKACGCSDMLPTYSFCKNAVYESIADYLITNGVTMQPVTEKRTGLYGKYSIFRADGTPVKDRCFVLKPDRDPVAVKALQTYAAATDDEQLRNDLYDWVGKPMPLPEPPKEE